MINSSLIGMHMDVEKLKDIFRKNEYPTSFIDNCILKFFNKMNER